MEKKELENLAELGEQTMKHKVKLALHKRKLETIKIFKNGKCGEGFPNALVGIIDLLILDVDNIKIGIIKGE